MMLSRFASTRSFTVGNIATKLASPRRQVLVRLLPAHSRRRTRQLVTQSRFYSSSSNTGEDREEKTAISSDDKSFEQTPLGSNGAHLLDGLDVYSVPAAEDGHPLAVYGIESDNPALYKDDTSLRPILLLHGRTWSSVPVYHLFGGSRHRAAGEDSWSLMEALLSQGLKPYCMDFRGFGGTAKDSTGYVEPYRCVRDTETVLDWISQRHGLDDKDECAHPPALLGWSQGALVAQLLAQKNPACLSKLVLYGSIYDPLYRYAREPLFVKGNTTPVPPIRNTFDMAIEDFTIQGTIAPEPACHFAETALLSDPIKAAWKHLHQFNNCDPGRINVPTLVVGGDQDPYAPLRVQQELFCNLGCGSDRTWSIVANSDHAVHMLEGRERLTNMIVSFVQQNSINVSRNTSN
jgi:pimeloyl-ACP methyl ester carboxylesterase